MMNIKKLFIILLFIILFFLFFFPEKMITKRSDEKTLSNFIYKNNKIISIIASGTILFFLRDTEDNIETDLTSVVSIADTVVSTTV